MGPKKQGFCSKINCIQMKLLYFVNWHSVRASKRAKIVLSKSIFDVKNQLNFFKKKSIKNINLGDYFLVKTFFSRLNFWRLHAMSIHKIQQFHLTTVDFLSKNLAFWDPSRDKLHDVTDISHGQSSIKKSMH